MMTPNGILLIRKEAGMTSHDVVNRLRRLYGTRQVGHTGTLDPMATGLLTLLIGRAVKASDYAMAERKRYVARLRLGITTDTEDTTGQVLSRDGAIPSRDEVEAILPRFRGTILQIPPMVSAIKVGGEKLLDKARRGEVIEREARPIVIHRLTASPTDRAEEYELDVTCSKGTYIRTLCADIGAALGCGGAMAALERVENGPHRLPGAVTLAEIEEMDEAARLALLLPVEQLFASSPILHLPPFFARLSHCGNPIYLKKLPASAFLAPSGGERLAAWPQVGATVRLYDEDGFFAVGRIEEKEDGVVARMEKMMRVEGK